MSLRENLERAFGVTKQTDISSSTHTPTGLEAFGAGLTDQDSSAKQRELLGEMRGWVGTAVSAIADEVATTQFRLFQMTDNGVEEVEEHPLVDLLFKVNDFTTKFDHFWLTQTYLELTGEAPWFLERENNGEIKNVYFLRPDRLSPVLGEDKMITAYDYALSANEKIRIPLEQVVFIKYPNPAKPYRGLGTLQMGARTVDIDNFAEEWNKNFFKNSARPDGVLTVNQPNMNEEQKKRLKKSLKENYEGVQNAHKIMVLFGDMEFEKAGFSMKDMDFAEQMRFGRDKILGIFRVPKPIVSQTEDVNLASARTAQFTFARWTIKPKLERLVQQLNEFLLPLYNDTDNMFIDFDNPVPEDQERKVEKYKAALQSGWMTINEVREEEGLPEVEGGDSIYINNRLVPVAGGSEGDTGSSARGIALPYKNKDATTKEELSYDRRRELYSRGKPYFKAQKDKKAIKNVVKDELRREFKREKRDAKEVAKTKGKNVSASYIKKAQGKKKDAEPEDGDSVRNRVWTESEQRTWWHVKSKIFDKFLESMTENTKKVFNAQRRQVLENFDASQFKPRERVMQKASSDDLYGDVKLNVEAEADRTLSANFGTIEGIFRESSEATFERLQTQSEVPDTEEIRRLIDDNGRRFATSVTESTNKQIRNEITRGLSRGENDEQIRDRLSGVFDDAEQYRAERIARTETQRYNSMATEDAFRRSGTVDKKMWVTDPSPCRFCATFAGKTMELGGTYLEKGDTVLGQKFDYNTVRTPPLHPNCYALDTEVYTGRGFVPIADVRKGEKVMTLSPKSGDIEWGYVRNRVYYSSQDVWNLTNRQHSFDLTVTRDHPFFGYKRVDGGKSGKSLRPVWVDGIDDLNSEFNFYTSSQWKGTDVDRNLGKYTLTANQFARFMGWYLSEGSVTKRGPGWYQVSISQQGGTAKETLVDDLSDLPFSFSVGKSSVYVNDASIGRYLLRFGKSWEKFVPDAIKAMTATEIRTFLDRYCIGDGHERKYTKPYKGGSFVPERVYTTSSRRMADDLGELLIKSGKSVSYSERKSGNVKHKNGTYRSRHVYVVNELTSQYRKMANIGVRYVGKRDVCDIEVDRHHTILVRHNDKVVWGSNCQCDLVPVFKDKVQRDRILEDQTERNLDVMYKMADNSKRELDEFSEGVAQEFPGAVVAKAPLKGRERAKEKILNDYGGDASRLTDVARNTIVLDRITDLDKAVDRVRRSENVVASKVIRRGDDPAGYTGANVKYQTSTGMTGEVQINSKEMIYAKEAREDAVNILGNDRVREIEKKVALDAGRGHRLYESIRSTNKAESVDELTDQSKAYYNAVRVRGFKNDIQNFTGEVNRADEFIENRARFTSVASDDERRVLNNYTVGSHRAINTALRSGDDVIDDATGKSGLSMAGELSVLTRRNKLGKQTYLYRGMTVPTRKLSDFEPGKTVKDNAFVSTTFDLNNAEDFLLSRQEGRGVSSVIMRIRGTENTRGVAPNAVFPDGEFTVEREFIIANNSRFKIVDRDVFETSDGRQITFIDMEYVDTD